VREEGGAFSLTLADIGRCLGLPVKCPDAPPKGTVPLISCYRNIGTTIIGSKALVRGTFCNSCCSI
jgi:hypothetical protein